MARKLAWAGGVLIVVTGTLLHFVYSWSGQRRVVGLVSPVNESVWEHTKLVVVPVLLLGGMELLLIHDRRRVVWASLVEAVLGALAIPAVFYAYTGAFGVGPVLWVDVASFVLIVSAGQWLHLHLLQGQTPVPRVAFSGIGLLALAWVYAVWTVAPPSLPLFNPN